MRTLDAWTYPYAQLDLLSLDIHLMHLCYTNLRSISSYLTQVAFALKPNNHTMGQARDDNWKSKLVLTRKSTPIVALLSSSGSHCSSEKRSNKLDFPTEEFPISRSLTLMGCVDVGAML